MLRYILRTAAAVAALLVAVGCAKDTTRDAASPQLPSTSADTSSTTPSVAKPNVNERGLIPKSLGEEAGLTDESGVTVATFAIDTVTVDPPCQEYSPKPDSGHTLLLEVRVSTADDSESLTYLAGLLNPFTFSEIGADGVTRTAQAGTCTDFARSLPSQYGVNQKYAGTIELVVPEASGALALQQSMTNTGGWEWKY